MLKKIESYIVGKFGKREKMDINQFITKYKTIWTIIFFLNIEDAFATLAAIRNSGVHELNPIMNVLLSSPPGFIIAKMTLVCILVFVIYSLSYFALGRAVDITDFVMKMIIFFMYIIPLSIIYVWIGGFIFSRFFPRDTYAHRLMTKMILVCIASVDVVDKIKEI